MWHVLKAAKGHTDIRESLLEEEVLDTSTTEAEVVVPNSSTINVVPGVYQMHLLFSSSSFINRLGRPNTMCTIHSLHAMKAVSILSTHNNKIRLFHRNTNTVNPTITHTHTRVSRMLFMSSIDFNSSMNINFTCCRDSRSLSVGCSSNNSFNISTSK